MPGLTIVDTSKKLPHGVQTFQVSVVPPQYAHIAWHDEEYVVMDLMWHVEKDHVVMKVMRVDEITHGEGW